jgi:hypothetical protein
MSCTKEFFMVAAILLGFSLGGCGKKTEGPAERAENKSTKPWKTGQAMEKAADRKGSAKDAEKKVEEVAKDAEKLSLQLDK